MFKEYDTVRLKYDDDEVGVKATFTGTIVDVPAAGVFTIEFFDEDGDTVMPALYKTYTADELVRH